MADLLTRALLGVLTGLLALAALSQGNGLTGLGLPLAGHLAAAALAGLLACLAATRREGGKPRERWGAAGMGVLLTAAASGLVFWHANESLPVEYGIDRGLLLPQLWALCPPMPGGERLAAGAACLVGGAVGVLAAGHRKAVARVALALVIVSFAVSAATLNPRIVQEATAVPQPGAYSADTFLFLRTAALMREGASYYPAFQTAYTQRKGEAGVPGNPLNWRPPLLAHLWAVLPDGATILGSFWLLATLSIAASWDLARRHADEVVALWAPLALAPYFLYGACSIWFGTYEYWAAFPLVCGLWACGTGRPTLGATLLGVSAMTREQFAYLLPLLVLIGLRDRRGRAACWGVVALAAIYYVTHYILARPYVVAGNRGLAAWSDGGPEFVYRCWMFGTVYFTGRDWLWVPTLVAGYGAAALASVRLRSNTTLLLVGAALVPSAAALLVGQVERWYWGAALVPQLLVALPFLTIPRNTGAEAIGSQPCKTRSVASR